MIFGRKINYVSRTLVKGSPMVAQLISATPRSMVQYEIICNVCAG